MRGVIIVSRVVYPRFLIEQYFNAVCHHREVYVDPFNLSFLRSFDQDTIVMVCNPIRQLLFVVPSGYPPITMFVMSIIVGMSGTILM